MGKSLELYLLSGMGNLRRGASNQSRTVIRIKIGQSIDTTLK